MAVDKLNPQFLTAFLSQHQRHINTLVVVILALYLLAFTADIVWRFIPEPQSQTTNIDNTVRSTTRQTKSASANVAGLQRLNLFGDVKSEVNAEPVSETAVTDAPETRLNLVLTGVVSSNDPELGAAIIEHKGTQDTYGVGEKIEGTNATLRQVQEDRVIIRNGTQDETLMLEGISFAEANRERQPEPKAMRNRNVAQAPVNNRPKLSQDTINATRQLRNSPDSFIDFISVAPQRKDNEIIGYRVSPGKNKSLFDAVGLKSGDVITQINGLDVTEAAEAMEAMNELRTSQSIELTISRKGEIINLFLELPEPSDV